VECREDGIGRPLANGGLPIRTRIGITHIGLLSGCVMVGLLFAVALASTSSHVEEPHEAIIRAYDRERLPYPDATTYHAFRYIGVRPSHRRRIEADMVCVSYTMRARFVGPIEVMAAVWIRDGRVLETIEGVPAATICALQ